MQSGRTLVRTATGIIVRIGKQYHRRSGMSKTSVRLRQIVSRILAGARVGFEPGTRQPRPVDVGVDLRGADISMSQQFLNYP